MESSPNLAGAVDAPIARLFAFDCWWRRATDQQRSVAETKPEATPKAFGATWVTDAK
jgi:hypothetical protein